MLRSVREARAKCIHLRPDCQPPMNGDVNTIQTIVIIVIRTNNQFIPDSFPYLYREMRETGNKPLAA
jgi:hypothetical protein